MAKEKISNTNTSNPHKCLCGHLVCYHHSIGVCAKSWCACVRFTPETLSDK